MASDRLWGNRKENIVILDSSAIMMLFEFSIDLEDELARLLGTYYIVVPSPIRNELVVLSAQGDGKKHQMAKASLKLIERYEIVNVDDEIADDAVVSLAKEMDGIVVTNDKGLRERLKKRSLSVIFLRAKQRLVLE
jgi:rRNA-processing protein FCF1